MRVCESAAEFTTAIRMAADKKQPENLDFFFIGRPFKNDSMMLLVTDDDAFNARRQLMQLAARKTGVAKHILEFGEGVGIAARRNAEHHHAESRCLRRRHSIIIGNKLERDCSATVCQGGVDFAQQRLASRDIEVMQEIR